MGSMYLKPQLQRIGSSLLEQNERAPAPTRRGFLRSAGAAALGGACLAALPTQARAQARAQAISPEAQAWGLFKERFVSNGRVIDRENGNISHSEGQGTALLAAAVTGDSDAFEKIYAWTRGNLSRPYDALHSWRYQPNQPMPVGDENNATDGDLLIAFALFTAAARWDMPQYRKTAIRMSRDISRALVRETKRGLVLLPGIDGFTRTDSVIVNPSYYVFPALQSMLFETQDPIWQRIMDDGSVLLNQARFGASKLPPDWLTIKSNGNIEISEQWPARFSFDAVRMPLYLCWGGMGQHPIVDAVRTYWSRFPKPAVPAWTNLLTGETAPYDQSSGMVAIKNYVADMASDRFYDAKPAPLQMTGGYYSAALELLTVIAKQQRRYQGG